MQVTVDRIEGDVAVLKTKDDSINFEKKYLPQGCKEGDILTIDITKQQEKSDIKKEEARNILNEILDSNGT